MQVQKTIVARLWKLTSKKVERLEEIFILWSRMLELKTYKERRAVAPSFHSAFARNAFKAKSSNEPVYLAHYDFEVKDTGNRLARWFVRLPYKPREPVWAPLRMAPEYEQDLGYLQIKDSRLVKDKNGFRLHIAVAKEVELNHAYSSVLGVDLGERILATTVLLRRDSAPAPPKFYGKNARGVRRHYAWLRRRFGERKLLRKIKEIGKAERRKISAICHKLSRAIINEAKTNNAIIVLGDLNGIRKRAKGKRMNRIISNMPYYKLSRYIEYKALWEGIPVACGSEVNSSRECHLCHAEGRRVTRGLLVCDACDHQWNADYNGAFNLAKRFWNYSFQNGAVGSPLLREACS